MAKYVGYKRPKDTKKTMKHFLTYLGHYKWAFFLVKPYIELLLQKQ